MASVEASPRMGVSLVWGRRVCVRNEGLEDDSELIASQQVGQVGQVGQLLTRMENSPG